MIANARMYSVAPGAATGWKALLAGLAARAGVDLDVIDYPAPAPLSDLWARPDQAAVFMCGLPYSRSDFRPEILVAPVPSPAGFDGKPQYWSDLVVRADSAFETLPDTFGHRLALTVRDSQSGYVAPLRLLTNYGGSEPLYDEVIAPRITPVGAITAVTEGLADVAPVDAYALRLLQQFRPELTVQVRVIAQTDIRPIPLLVASPPRSLALAAAFLTAHEDEALTPVMADLLLERFVLPDPEAYEVLSGEYEAMLLFWRRHRLATRIHPELIP
jgi:ABC-type phosphate/phosphonate transport system substrate-binding protein